VLIGLVGIDGISGSAIRMTPLSRILSDKGRRYDVVLRLL
jgi:hypothetical protein